MCCGELMMIWGYINRTWENITHNIKVSGTESIHLAFRSSQWCSWGFCSGIWCQITGYSLQCSVKTQWSQCQGYCTGRWDHYFVSKQKNLLPHDVASYPRILLTSQSRSVFPKLFTAHRPSFFFSMAQQTQWAKVSSLWRIHDHTQLHASHSVGLLWTSDQPDAETSTWHWKWP